MELAMVDLLAPAGLNQSQQQWVGDYIARHYGLYHSPERLPELERKLEQLSPRLGFGNGTQLSERLLGNQLTPEEELQLIEGLTVGETYFFREPEAIQALLDTIWPELQQRRPSHQPLRIWSAGCASGEEPYSLAMALDSQMSRMQPGGFSLLATDINRQSLEKAQQGYYTAWSFRAMPTHYKQRYFRLQSDGRWWLDPALRQQVQFTQMNLAAPDYPSILNGTHELDVIFCRNVLMYFNDETIAQIAERFARCLRPGGWLVLSQTECGHLFQSAFETVQIGGAFLYRKRGGPRLLPKISEPVMTSGGPCAPVNPEKTWSQPKPSPHTPTAITSTELFTQSRQLADQGALAQARTLCEQALLHHQLHYEGHYLHAMILQEQDEIAAAREALRRVLYLAPDFVLAHYALGMLELKAADHRSGERHLDQALRLLDPVPPEQLLPGSEGLSAGQLQDLLLQRRRQQE
jgi:chemotaxis protein methyltransferase CheR